MMHGHIMYGQSAHIWYILAINCFKCKSPLPIRVPSRGSGSDDKICRYCNWHAFPESGCTIRIIEKEE